MSHPDPAIAAAHRERRRYLDRILALALAVESSRANYSPGDEWTPTDDRVAFQISGLEDAICEAADQLTRASLNRQAAMDAAETALEARRLTEE